MVDETVLGSVALGLERSEQSLLGTENLNSRGGVLGQVGQAAGLGNQASSDSLANEGSQVGGNDTHLVHKVSAEALAVLRQAQGTVGEQHDIVHVRFGDIPTHADAGRVDDFPGDALVVIDNGGQIVQLILVQGALVANEDGQLDVLMVVRDDLDELREMPAIPLPDAHAESVDSLVELVESRNGLNDVIVVLLNAKLHLGARVGVSQTKLSAVNIALLELLEKLGSVQAEAAQQIGDNLADFGSLALDVGKVRLDASGQVLLLNTESNLVLLAGVRDVHLKNGLEVVGADTLGDVVLVLESLGSALEGSEALDLDRLAKSRKVLDLLLDLLQTVADGLGLKLDLEDLRVG